MVAVSRVLIDCFFGPLTWLPTRRLLQERGIWQCRIVSTNLQEISGAFFMIYRRQVKDVRTDNPIELLKRHCYMVFGSTLQEVIDENQD
jgi:hypothetical protein